MLKHSPMPWTIEPGDEPENREIWDNNLQCVLTVYGHPEAEHAGPEQDQLENDTRLLHAAPRMYALIRDMVDMNLARAIAPNLASPGRDCLERHRGTAMICIRCKQNAVDGRRARVCDECVSDDTRRYRKRRLTPKEIKRGSRWRFRRAPSIEGIVESVHVGGYVQCDVVNEFGEFIMAIEQSMNSCKPGKKSSRNLISTAKSRITSRIHGVLRCKARD